MFTFIGNNESGGSAPNSGPSSGYNPPVGIVPTSLTEMAPMSANSSPTHSGGSSITALPLINGQNGIGGHQPMLMPRVPQMTTMSPDSEDDAFPIGLSNHHHQPFKQEVTEGIDNAYT